MNALVELPPPTRTIELNIRLCMSRRGIRSVSELHRKLIANGVEISHAQLNRITDNRAHHWSTQVLNGLLQVLDCRISDLIVEVEK